MATAQELFDHAEQHYLKTINLINEMDKAFQNAMKGELQPYDSRSTIAEFDFILQTILLNIAISDGVFSDIEKQFIDKITNFGDILRYVAKETGGQIDITWDVLKALPTDTQKKLIDILPTIIEKRINSFLIPMAAVDSVVSDGKDVDFMDAIVEAIRNIAICLSAVDGKAEEREMTAAAEAVFDLLVIRWNEIKK